LFEDNSKVKFNFWLADSPPPLSER
jgi:hypothetical protein